MNGEEMDVREDQATSSWMVRVTDLKQYVYCPRVLFYMYCLSGLRPITYKMTAGIAAQEQVTRLEMRRTLRAYGIAEGVRHFYVPVESRRLGCVGQIDLVIEHQEGAERRLTPVDFKLSRREPGEHFKLQLACYGMMLEESWRAPAPDGMIYLIPRKQVIPVALTARLRTKAAQVMATIRELLEQQRMPPATPHRGRCVHCEYRRFCNDVI